MARVLAFEFACGGGTKDAPHLSGLFCEGFAMLHGLASDLVRAGHEVVVTLDEKYQFLEDWFQKCLVDVIRPQDSLEDRLEGKLTEVDAAYVLAPESGGELERLARQVVAAGVELLSVNPNAVATFSTKSETNRLLEVAGLPVPRWALIRGKRPLVEEVADLDLTYPVVMKPDDGVGGEGVTLLRNPEILRDTLGDRGDDARLPGPTLVQEYVPGTTKSLSLVHVGEELVWGAANEQVVRVQVHGEGGAESAYVGGVSPVETRAWKDVEALVSTFHRAGSERGHLGVDFVEDRDGNVWFLEVNPRLTTSYVGLRRTVAFNLGELVAFPATARVKPEVGFTSRCLYRRFTLFNEDGSPIEELPPDLREFEKLARERPEVVTPLFSRGESSVDFFACAELGREISAVAGSSLAARLRNWLEDRGVAPSALKSFDEDRHETQVVDQ
ncbi:MAG: hypothetical protein Kow0069_21600 [Promethearchaeota archaeon]